MWNARRRRKQRRLACVCPCVCLYVSVREERRSKVWLQRDVGVRRVVRGRVGEEVCGSVVCMDVLWKSRMREWCEWMCSVTE